MAEDSNGNFIVADGTNIAPNPGTRAVRVYHTGINPVGNEFAPGQAIAIGTGAVGGYVWKKASTTPNNTDWVQVLP